MSIAEIAIRNPGSLRVFEEFQIDYCRHGALELEEACRRAYANPAEVRAALDAGTISTGSEPVRLTDWPIDLLVRFLVESHNRFVKTILPEIILLSKKVSSAYGEVYPMTVELNDLVNIMYSGALPHLTTEETVVFPLIRKLDRMIRFNEPEKFDMTPEQFRTTIEELLQDHNFAVECLSRIRRLTNNYRVPDDGCISFNLLYKRLEQYEEDLHQHFHLENNILFPRALDLCHRYCHEYNAA